MLIFCVPDVHQLTVMSDMPWLDVLSLPEVNIRWRSFGRDEHIRRRIKTLVSSPNMMFFQSWQQQKTSQTFS
jgi:hypothetical protein